MRWLGFIGLLLVGLTFVAPLSSGGGWFWDIGNWLGFAALALMLHLFIDSGRGRGVKRHQSLAWLAVGAAVCHAIYFVVLDATLIEYLQPTMPIYMAIGILALVLLLVTAITSITAVRRRLYASRDEFKRLHWWFSALLLATAGYHVIGSAFYYNTTLQMLLLTILIAGLALWSRSHLSVPTVTHRPPSSAIKWAVGVLVAIGIVFVLPRNL